MPDQDFPVEDLRYSNESDVLGRWELYLESGQNRTEYFERYIVKSVSEDVRTRIMDVREYSAKKGYDVLMELMETMEKLRLELEAEDESSSDSVNDK